MCPAALHAQDARDDCVVPSGPVLDEPYQRVSHKLGRSVFLLRAIAMGDDTNIGGLRADYPATSWSAIAGAASGDPAERKRSFATLVAAYWKPAYKHVRVKWRRSNEDAKDIIQGFFTRSMEKGFFDSYDPAKARFRTFLRLCLDRYVQNEAQALGRHKRGGDAELLSLDFDIAQEEIDAAAQDGQADFDRIFDKEWARSLFTLAIDSLRRECVARAKEPYFRLFERHDLHPTGDGDRPTYAALARGFDISVSDVTNHLAWARRELRRLVLEHLRELTANDEEFRLEARLVLGIDPK